MSSTQSESRPSVDVPLPVRAMTPAPILRAAGMRALISAVSPEFEIAIRTSSLRIRPRSPWSASDGCRQSEGVPVEASVAEIFCADRAPPCPCRSRRPCPRSRGRARPRRRGGDRRAALLEARDRACLEPDYLGRACSRAARVGGELRSRSCRIEGWTGVLATRSGSEPGPDRPGRELLESFRIQIPCREPIPTTVQVACAITSAPSE